MFTKGMPCSFIKAQRGRFGRRTRAIIFGRHRYAGGHGGAVLVDFGKTRSAPLTIRTS